MPSLYLQAKDYPVFGVSSETTADAVIRASTLIDAYLRRPEGLISSDGAVMDRTGAPVVETFLVPVSHRIVLTRTPVVSVLLLETTDLSKETWREANRSGDAAYDAETGYYWLPSDVVRPARVRVTYIAGWTYAALPDDVKLACAMLLRADTAFEGLPSNIKKATVGDASYERFAPGNIDPEVGALLARYRRVIAAC